MPYGQILEIMVALILVSGAPEQPASQISPAASFSLWFLKACFWYLLCLSVFKKRSGGRLSKVELWEWAALLPFIADIYFLNVNLLFARISSFFGMEALKEILGIILFFFYLSLVWSTGLRTGKGKPLFNKTVYPRLRLLAPVVIPYFFLMLLIDLLKRLPLPLIKSWLHSDYSSFVLFILFLFFFLFLLPPLIVKLWKCSPLPPSELRRRIALVLKSLGMTFSDIMLWTTGETMACTAAVMGIVPGFRYILLTPCLTRFLLPEEIEAVIAHEVEHVRRRHILWYVIFLAGYSAVLYRLADPLITWLLSNPEIIKFLLLMDEIPAPFLSLLSALPIGILIILYFRFIIGYFMRNFERQADMAAFRVHGHPFFLINALKKVAVLSGINPEKPNWHHFSIAERINFLESAYANPAQLSEHNLKLNRSRAVFLIAACLLFLMPSVLPTKTWETRVHSNILQLYYEKLVQKDERNPRLYLALGEIAFGQKRYREAELAYKKALKMEPGNAEALNNLAWLYIKSEDPDFRRPKEALLMAMEAARIKPEPFILDTLAECLFQNGYTSQALNAEKEALEKAHRNRNYYKRQMERFKKGKQGAGKQQKIN